jgi:hypothetical protein
LCPSRDSPRAQERAARHHTSGRQQSTDLHILKGDVTAVTEGRILGREGVGTVTEVGAAVTTLAVGDRVIISCVSSCGSCCTATRACTPTAWRTGEPVVSAGSSAPDRRHAGRTGPGAVRRQLLETPSSPASTELLEAQLDPSERQPSDSYLNEIRSLVR